MDVGPEFYKRTCLVTLATEYLTPSSSRNWIQHQFTVFYTGTSALQPSLVTDLLLALGKLGFFSTDLGGRVGFYTGESQPPATALIGQNLGDWLWNWVTQPRICGSDYQLSGLCNPKVKRMEKETANLDKRMGGFR